MNKTFKLTVLTFIHCINREWRTSLNNFLLVLTSALVPLCIFTLLQVSFDRFMSSWAKSSGTPLAVHIYVLCIKCNLCRVTFLSSHSVYCPHPQRLCERQFKDSGCVCLWWSAGEVMMTLQFVIMGRQERQQFRFSHWIIQMLVTKDCERQENTSKNSVIRCQWDNREIRCQK